MRKCILIYILTFLFAGCGEKNKDDDIPVVSVNILIDLNINSSAPLNTLGGYIYVAGGNKGIIVFHNFDDSYMAIERTCSFHPYDTCNLITMDNSGLILKCGKYSGPTFIDCCGSAFTLEGFASKAPATRPLRLYTVSKSANQLRIFN